MDTSRHTRNDVSFFSNRRRLDDCPVKRFLRIAVLLLETIEAVGQVLRKHYPGISCLC